MILWDRPKQKNILSVWNKRFGLSICVKIPCKISHKKAYGLLRSSKSSSTLKGLHEHLAHKLVLTAKRFWNFEVVYKTKTSPWKQEICIKGKRRQKFCAKSRNKDKKTQASTLLISQKIRAICHWTTLRYGWSLKPRNLRGFFFVV